jgi:hypothetical protein
MIIKILKDTTITVTAGQTVEAKDEEALRAISLGFAEPVNKHDEQPKPAKKAIKKAGK